MPRIMVRLDDVVCFDPEEITGSGDEFYVIGAVSDGEQTEGITTVPVQVAKNETKPFGVGGGIVFDAEVPTDRLLKIAMTAFDEDAAKDWSQRGKIVDEIAAGVADGLATIPNPKAQAAGAVLQFVLSVAGGLIKLDEDDNLGSYSQDFPVWALAVGEHPQQWQFNGSWGGGFLGFSKWSYALRYAIVVQ